jgi:hypothetical protein
MKPHILLICSVVLSYLHKDSLVPSMNDLWTSINKLIQKAASDISAGAMPYGIMVSLFENAGSKHALVTRQLGAPAPLGSWHTLLHLIEHFATHDGTQS